MKPMAWQDRVAELVTTFFYAGYFPAGPGTFTSAVGVLIYFGLYRHPGIYVLVTVLVTIAGLATSSRMERMVGKKDPGCIVIDEVAGIMIALFLLPPVPSVLWTAFFLFRAFDMFKIYPVNKYEHLPGGVGVMLDDIVAGLYTCLVMHLAILLSGM